MGSDHMMSLVVPGLDLEKIYQSGQALRWQKVQLLDNLYYVVVSGKHFTAIQQKGDRLVFTCSSNHVYDYWFEYFDMRQDYVELSADIHMAPRYFSRMADDSFGLHVLKMETWEVMLSVLMMRKSSLSKARSNMQLLCSLAGKSHDSALCSARLKWHETPDSEDIVKHVRDLESNDLFIPVLQLAERVDVLGDLIIDSMELDSNGKNMAFMRSLEVFTPQEARKVLSWGLGRRNVIALSVSQASGFARTFGSSPLEWMRSNSFVRDGCFQGRMDYFSQIVRYEYITRKQEKSNGNS